MSAQVGVLVGAPECHLCLVLLTAGRLMQLPRRMGGITRVLSLEGTGFGASFAGSGFWLDRSGCKTVCQRAPLGLTIRCHSDWRSYAFLLLGGWLAGVVPTKCACVRRGHSACCWRPLEVIA